jgi:hypothetical protein
VDWVKKHAIVVIVTASVLGGVVLSVVEVEAGEKFAAVLLGLTLVASVAILASAITAAVYAKPAYDEAVAHLRPVALLLHEVSLRDPLDHEVQAKEVAGSPPVYEIGDPYNLVIRATLQNVGDATAYFVLNFRVPVQVGLRPLDDPRKGHYVSADERVFPFGNGLEVRSSYSVADAVLPKRLLITYAAQITIPAADSPWTEGWPMRIVVRGRNDAKVAVDHEFLVKVIREAAAPAGGEETAPSQPQ